MLIEILIWLVLASAFTFWNLWALSRTPKQKRVDPVVDVRATLREYRRRELAEWDAEFRRLGGGSKREDRTRPGEYEVICDWSGRVVRRIRGDS